MKIYTDGASFMEEIPLWYSLAVFFVLGACVGSFYNVIVYRMPRGISLINPPSHCPLCKKHIPLYYNLPIVGWLILRGKSACCKQPISIIYPIGESLCGLLGALALYAATGFTTDFTAPVQSLEVWADALALFWLLLGIYPVSAVDFKYKLIPLDRSYRLGKGDGTDIAPIVVLELSDDNLLGSVIMVGDGRCVVYKRHDRRRIRGALCNHGVFTLITPCLAEVHLAADFFGAVPVEEGVRRSCRRAVAVVQRDCHGAFGRFTDEGRVEFGDACVKAAVFLALIEVAVDVAEFPPVILHVFVTEVAHDGVFGVPFRRVEVDGFVIDRFVATPQVNGICCGNDTYRMMFHQEDYGWWYGYPDRYAS